MIETTTWRRMGVIAGVLWAQALLAVPALGDQPESPVACVEGAEPVALGYGDHASCTLSPQIEADRFAFHGEAGDLVRISLLHTGGYLEPDLELRDPDGEVLHRSSCSGSGCTVVVEPPGFDLADPPIAALAETGTYQITVRDDGMNATGTYVVQVESLPPPEDPRILGDGQAESSSVGPGTDVDFYDFEGEAGADVRFVLLHTSGYLDPRLEIWDPDMVKVHDATCSAISCTVQVRPESFSLAPSPGGLPKTGRYLIAVSDHGSNATGGFQLNAVCLRGPCPSADALFHDDPRGASVSPATDIDRWAFHGVAGTRVRLSVVHASGYLDPRVEIWDPDEEKIHDGVCTASACSVTVEPDSFSIAPSAGTLASTGTYTVAISDSGANATGSYAVSVQCLVGDCDSDGDGTPDGVPETLGYGVPEGATVGPQADRDTFAFHGVAGGDAAISVLHTGGYLDPRLEIWGPEGEKLHASTCNASGCLIYVTPGDFSEAPSPGGLPLTGVYTVLVSDHGSNATGSYQVGVDCLFGSCGDEASIPVAGDNCIQVPNAGPLACDTDGDGFGNACDCDFNGSGTCTSADFNGEGMLLDDYSAGVDSGTGTDMNCSGQVSSTDFVHHFVPGLSRGAPGPSGLSCAGTPDCP